MESRRGESRGAVRRAGSFAGSRRSGLLAVAVAALVTALLLCAGCSQGGAVGGVGDTDSAIVPSSNEMPDDLVAPPDGALVQADYESHRGERMDAVASYDVLRDAIWATQEDLRAPEVPGAITGVGAGWMWPTASCEGEFEANEAAPSSVVADGSLVFIGGSKVDEFQLSYIKVIDVSSGTPVQKATISAEKGSCIVSLHAEGGKLYVLSLVAAQEENGDAPWTTAPRTRLLTYSFADPAHPKLETTMEQSGAYMTARFVDGYAYVASVFHPAQLPVDADPSWFVPAVNGVFLDPKDICDSYYGGISEYLVITAVSLDNPGDVLDRIAVAGDGGYHYVGETALYDVGAHYVPNGWNDYYHAESAIIRKISYADGCFDFARQATVEGGVSPQTMTEHNGMFRIQLTGAVEGGSPADDLLSFVVFDEQMNLVGRLSDFGTSNMAIYAGTEDDVALYRVYGEGGETMRSLNLADPANLALSEPLAAQVSSELRLYGPGMALGIDRHHGEAPDGGHLEGSLLTMLDVADPADVAETGSLTLEGAWSGGITSLYEPLAYMDSDQGIILFIATTEPEYETYFYGLRVGEDGSLTLARKDLVEGDLNNSFHAVWTDGAAGEALWVVVNGAIARCDPETLELSDFAKW